MIARRLSRIACFLMAGLVSASALAEPKRGGSLTYAYISGPGTLDPHVSSSLVELEVINHLFESLVAMDGQYNTKPALAQSIDVSPDAKTYTFKLRPGVTFHTGQAMTSADVLASFERYRRISPNADILADVESMTAPDPSTFVVGLKKPNGVFLDILKSPVYPLAILPADQKDKAGRAADVVGTGPFRLGEWVKDSHLQIRRFDGYAADTRSAGADGLAGRKTAYLDSVRYNFVPEANGRVAALLAGDADVIGDVPPDLLKRLEGRPDITVQKIFPYCMQVFIVNTSQGPTANPKVRQAIDAVVNVDEIAEAMGRVFQKSHSLVYATSPYYQGDAMKAFYDQKNVDKAKTLLKEGGYKGETITLQTNSNYAHYRDAILVLSEQMKEAGMAVKVDVTDWTTNASNMQRGTGTWNVSTTGYCSNPLVGPHQWKSMFYTFPQVKNDAVLDAAYEKFFASTAIDGRKEAWNDIERRVLDQAYMIKIIDVGAVRAFNNTKVENFQPYYLVRFWDVGRK